MSVKDRITNTLEQALSPLFLAVYDESHQHAGHGGWREGGETHFRVEIVAAAFIGRSRVERHRMINALLASELADQVHALALSTRTPDEAAAVHATPASQG
jgi:BolA family transcriptional regulator, general stress-responsive regulator